MSSVFSSLGVLQHLTAAFTFRSAESGHSGKVWVSIRKTRQNGSEEFQIIFVNKAITGNNCNYSFAVWTSVSDPRGKRDGNKWKIEIDIALKNQCRFETESQASLKFLCLEHLLLLWPLMGEKSANDAKQPLKSEQPLRGRNLLHKEHENWWWALMTNRWPAGRWKHISNQITWRQQRSLLMNWWGFNLPRKSQAERVKQGGTASHCLFFWCAGYIQSSSIIAVPVPFLQM